MTLAPGAWHRLYSLIRHRFGGLVGGGDEPVRSRSSARSTLTRPLDRLSSRTDSPPKLVESVEQDRRRAPYRQFDITHTAPFSATPLCTRT